MHSHYRTCQDQLNLAKIKEQPLQLHPKLNLALALVMNAVTSKSHWAADGIFDQVAFSIVDDALIARTCTDSA